MSIVRDNGIAWPFFSPAVRDEFASCGNNLIKLYSLLSAEAYASQERLWKFSPKHHLVEHMCLHCAQNFGNPRFYWTYSDEDLVGLCVEVAKSCHVRTFATVSLVKWLLLTFLMEPDA